MGDMPSITGRLESILTVRALAGSTAWPATHGSTVGLVPDKV